MRKARPQGPKRSFMRKQKALSPSPGSLNGLDAQMGLSQGLFISEASKIGLHEEEAARREGALLVHLITFIEKPSYILSKSIS